jgi:hypothetical protein
MDTIEATTAPKPKGTTRNRKPDTKPKRRRGAPHKYIDVDALGRTVGIEVTFVPGGYEEDEIRVARDAFGEMTRAMGRVFAHRLTKQFPAAKKLTHNCGVDPDVVEVSTAPVSTRRLLGKVLSAYYTVAGSLSMVPSYEWHGGGGAHIHVGRKKGEHKDMDCAMAMFATHHPYMTWAFMNPGDNNKNAKIHCALVKKTVDVAELRKGMAAMVRERDKCVKRGSMSDARYYQNRVGVYLKALLGDKHKRDSTAQRAYADRMDSFGKGAAIARRTVGRYGTWEFRLFRAPDSMEGHTRQLNFALAYTEYCEQLARSGKIPKPYTATLEEAHKAHPFPVAVAKFNKLLRTLGLDARKYRADIENMRRYYLINKLDMTYTATTTEEVYIKPVTVRLPRSMVHRKHKRGVMPEGVPFKVSRATRRAAKAERKAREEYIETHGLRRSDLRLKMGDTVTHMDGGTMLTATITRYDHTDDTQPFRLSNGFWVTHTGRTNFHTDPKRDPYRILTVNGLTIIED